MEQLISCIQKIQQRRNKEERSRNVFSKNHPRVTSHTYSRNKLKEKRRD